MERDRRYQSLLADGDRSLASGDAVSAVEAFSGAVALRPDAMGARLRRGQAYRALQRGDEAIRDWQTAARQAPQSVQPLELLGDIYSTRGEDAQAATYYERAVALDAADPVRQYKLALARYRAGALASAIDPLRRAVGLNDNFAEAHYLLGLVLRDTQAPAAAAAELERAVRVAPSFSPAREELADLYRAMGRSVDELSELQALASLDPSTPRDVAIAIAEARTGQYDGAAATLTAAAERDPDDARIQLALGQVYLAKAERRMDRRSVTLALEALEKALDDPSRAKDGLTLLGRALYLSGDDAGAERVLRQALDTPPVRLNALAYLADACERQKEFDAAREALQQLDALQGDTVASPVRMARAARMGQLAARAGDFTAAFDDLTRAADNGVRDVPTLTALAEAAWKTGRPDEAKAALAEAAGKAPRDPDVVRLRRMIR